MARERGCTVSTVRLHCLLSLFAANRNAAVAGEKLLNAIYQAVFLISADTLTVTNK